MSKKVIFIGPSGAGKTTIKKIFFEGENSTKLLEYALEPTFGEESLILRLPGLREEIGVFDLAGQENDRWLDTEENDIFFDAKIIILVIDASKNLESIKIFIKKVFEVRDKITPSTLVYVLLHKIDLISPKKINEIKYSLKSLFSSTNSAKFVFTSLKKKFFKQTFSYFIDIMKDCISEEISDDGLMFNIIEESIKIIDIINQNVVISKESIFEILNRPEKLVNYLLESLIQKEHIIISNDKSKELYSLTEKGKSHYKLIQESFTSRKLVMDYEQSMPSFLGAFISDKDGKLLLKFEAKENILENYLLAKSIEPEATSYFDLDLIPMFISALEKFSLELNINELTKLGLEGTNLKIRVYGYDFLTVTLFINPNVNLEPFEYIIKNFFENLFLKFENQFQSASNTGNLDNLLSIKVVAEEWLAETNQKYEDMIISLDLYDDNQAKEIYERMDDLYDKIKLHYSSTLERVKVLKVSLVKAILEKDYDQIKLIANQLNKIILKFSL